MLDTVRSEGRKLGTLPVIPTALLTTLAVMVGLAAMISVTTVGGLDDNPEWAAAFDPLADGFQTIHFGQIGMVVLGVLAVSGEYSGAQIRTSLLAVPGRGRFLASKALVVALMALVTAAVTVPVVMVATQVGLGDYGLPLADVLEADVLERMAGAALYWVLIALLAAGLTVIVRNAVVPIAVLGAMVMALSMFLATFTELAEWLPDRAGSLMYMPLENPLDLTAVQGGAVMAAWVAAVWLVAVVLFRRRDA